MNRKVRINWIYCEVELFCRRRLADDPADRETQILLIFMLVLLKKSVEGDRGLLVDLQDEYENLKNRSNLIYFPKAEKAIAEQTTIR